MKLSLEMKSLCLLLQSKEDTAKICEEITEHVLCEKEFDGIVVWLIQAWCFSSVKYKQCFGLSAAKKLKALDICRIVKQLAVEEQFVRALLMLSELKKRPLINSICNELSTNKEDNIKLAHHLYQSSLNEYCRNFMTYCSHEYDSKTFKVFSQNISTILKSVLENVKDFSKFTLPIMRCLDSLIIDGLQNALVELDKYSLRKYTVSDCYMVERYLRQLNQGLDNKTWSNNTIWANIQDFPEYINMVLYAVEILKKSLVSHLNVIDKEQQETLLISLAIKLKIIIGSFSKENMKDVLVMLQECIDIFRNVFDESELIKYICEEASSNEISDMKNTCPENNLYTEVWKNLDDVDKKISLSFHIIQHLNQGHDEVFLWLLRYHDIRVKFLLDWKQIAKFYIINHGTLDNLKIAIDLIIETISRRNINYNCLQVLQKIVLEALQRTTRIQLNKLMLLCHVHYTQHQLFLSSGTDLSSELNGILNKLTDDDGDDKENISHDLAVLCFVSPHTVVNEIFIRIFENHLKNTSIMKVLRQLPSLATLTFLNEENKAVTFLQLVKHNFIRYKENPTAEEHLADILILTNKCVTKETISTIIDDFIYPNLCEEEDVSFQTIIRILKELLNNNEDDLILMSQIILLLEVLLCYLKTSDGEISVRITQLFQEIDNIVNALIDAVRNHYEKALQQTERNGMVNFMKQLLQDHDWSIAFYMYPFLNLIGQQENIQTPDVFVNKFSLNENEYDVLNDSNYTDDYGGWAVLFEMFIINEKITILNLQSFPEINGGYEFKEIVSAIQQVFLFSCVDKFKASKIIQCLNHLIDTRKLKQIDSFVPETLIGVTSSHGYCLNVQILLETFNQMFSHLNDQENLNENELYNLNAFPKVLDYFNKVIKDIKEPLHTCYFALYFLEHSLKLLVQFNVTIRNSFLLLLTDTLVILIKTSRILQQGDDNAILQLCQQIIDTYAADDQIFEQLKRKYEELAVKL